MREPWVVYVVVLGTVGAMLLGKFWMGGGGEKNNSDKDKLQSYQKVYSWARMPTLQFLRNAN